MPDDDVLDVYSDQFRINTTPYGANLVFAKTQPDAPAGQAPRSKDQVIVRMSLEHLKVMQRTGITIELPFDMLNSMGLSKEDW